MKIESGKLERLKFLSRVVEKESHHLAVSLSRVFKEPFTVERAKTAYSDEDFSESLEAFTSRFARLQDTLGDKLIPHLLNAMGEKPASVIDNLDKAERFGWITSADEWLAIRDLRNQMVHEFIEDLVKLTSAIQTAQTFVPTLLSEAKALENEPQKRGWSV